MKESPNSVVLSYSMYGGGRVPIYLPMVGVVMSHNDNILTTNGLVDSGSNITVVPLHVAQSLEIELTEQDDSVMGVGGSLNMHLAKVDGFTIIEEKMTLAEFDDQVVRVSTSENRSDFIILGRNSIFRRFDIKFQEIEKRMQLYPN